MGRQFFPFFFPRLTRNRNEKPMTRHPKRGEYPKETAGLSGTRKRLAPCCWWSRTETRYRWRAASSSSDDGQRFWGSWEGVPLIMRVAVSSFWLREKEKLDKILAHSHVLSVRSVFNQQPKVKGGGWAAWVLSSCPAGKNNFSVVTLCRLRVLEKKIGKIEKYIFFRKK